MTNTHLVFVYGSLKIGFHNHPLLTDHNAVPLGDAVTVERYLLLKGSAFPFLINPEHFTTKQDCGGLTGCVAGELYSIDDECLARMDKLESHPRFYRREEIFVECNSLVPVNRAWCYFLNRPSERWDNPMYFIRNACAKPDAQGVVSWKLSDVYKDAADADAKEE